MTTLHATRTPSRAPHPHARVATATLFVSLGRALVTELGPTLDDQMTHDPTRLVHAVAIGVGFLGAGATFVHDESNRVRGLTTAASIWATAAVGAAVGLGRWVLAAGATVVVLFVLAGIHRLEKRWMTTTTRADDANERLRFGHEVCSRPTVRRYRPTGGQGVEPHARRGSP